MTLLRRILPSILCCVIAFGYAPAWLHVSTCNVHQLSGIAPETALPSSLSICSHFHISETHVAHDCGANGDGDPHGQHSHNEHNSDTCFVCHSLANSNGLTLTWELTLVSTSVCLPVSLSNDPVFIGTSLSIASPRGPPTAA